MQIRVTDPTDEGLLVSFHYRDTVVATIAGDGTVTVKEFGGDAAAARIFWELLEFHGKALMQQLAESQAEVLRLQRELAEARVASQVRQEVDGATDRVE